jgi:hypothetical protein
MGDGRAQLSWRISRVQIVNVRYRRHARQQIQLRSAGNGRGCGRAAQEHHDLHKL